MTCDLDKKYIYIYKGDDTNWNNEQFLTVNVTSEAVDLSTMTAKFILGSYTKTYPLTTGSFQIDLAHAVTGNYATGPINGVIQILDAQGRIKTASNTIPFYVTNKVIASQDMTYNVPVPEGSEFNIDVNIGFGDVAWGKITGNINDQLDLKAALFSKVSKVGDTMTGDLVMDDASVDFGDFKVSTDDGLAKIEGTQYGLRVDTTSGLGAALLTTRGLGEVLTTLDIKNTYSATNTDPISGQGVSQAISTKQDNLTTAQLAAVNSGIDSTKVAQIATNAQNISNEALARQGADNNLQTQIDALSAASDVKDIVGTYAELQAYDTSKLGNNDIIKVLTDETHDGAPSYYRWSTTTHTFTYIGSESAAYTKGEADAKFETITGAATTYATKSELSTGLATKASNADGTTIVDNGSTISTVAVKEQNANLAIKEWVGTKAEFDLIGTKDTNTLYTVTDDPDTQAIIVDSALSSTSENPVQNKVINTALATKQDALPSGTTGNYLQKTASGVTWAAVDALPSQTGHAGEYLTTDGTTASWGAVQSGGIQNESSQTGALAIGGYNSTVSTNKGTQGTILIGNGASARDNNSSYSAVIVGYNAAGANGSVSLGRSANNSTYDSTYNVGIGNNSRADNYGVSIGAYAKSSINAVAVGAGSSTTNNTQANSTNAIAIGNKAVADAISSIQLGQGTNSTASTLQVFNYPVLDASGNIQGERLSNIVAGPGLKILQGTPNTVTVTDFYNGSVEVPWQNPTSSLEMVLHFKSPSSYASQENALFELEGGDAIACQTYGSSSSYNIWLNKRVGTPIATGTAVMPNMSTNTDFFFKMEWNGSKYTFSYKTTGGWTQYATITSSVAIAATAGQKLRVGAYNDGVTSYRDAIFYMYDSYIKVDGAYIFNGLAATATDYDVIGTPIISGTSADLTSGKLCIMLDN